MLSKKILILKYLIDAEENEVNALFDANKDTIMSNYSINNYISSENDVHRSVEIFTECDEIIENMLFMEISDVMGDVVEDVCMEEVLFKKYIKAHKDITRELEIKISAKIAALILSKNNDVEYEEFKNAVYTTLYDILVDYCNNNGGYYLEVPYQHVNTELNEILKDKGIYDDFSKDSVVADYLAREMEVFKNLLTLKEEEYRKILLEERGVDTDEWLEKNIAKRNALDVPKFDIDGMLKGIADELGISEEELNEQMKNISESLFGSLNGMGLDVLGKSNETRSNNSQQSNNDAKILNLEFNSPIGALRDLDNTFNGCDTYTDDEVSELNKNLRGKDTKDSFDELVLHTLKRYNNNPISVIRQILFKLGVALNIDLSVVNTDQFGERKELMIFNTKFGEYRVAYSINHTKTKDIYDYIFSSYK